MRAALIAPSRAPNACARLERLRVGASCATAARRVAGARVTLSTAAAAPAPAIDLRPRRLARPPADSSSRVAPGEARVGREGFEALQPSGGVTEELLGALVRAAVPPLGDGADASRPALRRCAQQLTARAAPRPSRRARARALALAELVCLSARTGHGVDGAHKVAVRSDAFAAASLAWLPESALVRLAWASTSLSKHELCGDVASTPRAEPRQVALALASAEGGAQTGAQAGVEVCAKGGTRGGAEVCAKGGGVEVCATNAQLCPGRAPHASPNAAQRASPQRAQLVESLARELLARSERLNLRQTARASWAIAKAHQALHASADPRAAHGAAAAREALLGLCARASQLACAPARLAELDGRELAILAWAGARAASGPRASTDGALASRELRHRLLDPIAREVTCRPPSALRFADGATVAWALARAEGWALAGGVRVPSGEACQALRDSRQAEAELFAALAARSSDVRRGALRTGELCALVWSLATAGHAPPALLAECTRALECHAHSLPLRDQVRTLWALVTLDTAPSRLALALVGALNALLPSGQQASATSLQASATSLRPCGLDIMSAAASGALPARVEPALGGTWPRSLQLHTDADWAPALIAALAGHGARGAAREGAGARAAGARAAAPLSAMLHAAWLGLELERGARAHATSPPRLRAEFSQLWLEHVAPVSRGMTYPSALHARVVRALSRARVGHVCELLVPEGGYHVDIALTERQRTVIDVLGPSHFRFGTALKSSSVAKHRHLRAAGWSVLCVPWWQWPMPAAGAPESARDDLERRYVRALLSDASRASSWPAGCAAVGGESEARPPV
ncbi:hypothetical protein KFE25_009506 [Diacronema lutheri]|uniref:RAP domain-containing protein n=1 Tax=Diacronema lutheri TaxID=2081491 RepID=A0A8J5Y3S8_DIALT|nr:hypothetical protein KFE25_009506 [Diacronema lutheri]